VPETGERAGPDAVVLPLSYEQEWLFVRKLVYPDEALPRWGAYDVEGPLDAAAFARAVEAVAARHQAMRTAFFLDENGQPRQRIDPRPKPGGLRLQRVDSKSRDQFEAFARALARHDADAPWDTDAEPPYRMRLLRYSDTSHIFVATFHHVAFDFTALQVVEREIWESYFRDGQGGTRNSGRDLADVIPGQRGRYDHRASSVNARYWLERHAVAPPVWQRAAAAGTPSAKILDHMTISAHYDRDLLRRLAAVCRKLGCSRFELYLCIFSWIAFQLSRQDRLAIAVIFDSRAADEPNIVGMFSGMHPVVLDRPDGAPGAYLSQVRKEMLRAMVHRNVSGEDVLTATMRQWSRWQIPPRRALAINYLRVADTDWADPPRGDLRIARQSARTFAPFIGVGPDSLHLILRESSNKLEAYLEYNPQSAAEDLATAVLSAFGAMLTSAAESSGVVLTPLDDPSLSGQCDPPSANLTPVLDSDGVTCMHADTSEVSAILGEHPKVAAADVRVEKQPDGGSELVAYVAAEAQVSDEELRDFCRQWPTASSYAIVPGRIRREPAGQDAGSERGVAGDLLALLMSLLPGSAPDSEFWAAGGTLSVIWELTRRAAAAGLPEPEPADFGQPRTLADAASAIVSRGLR
jgi:hypothetical protein